MEPVTGTVDLAADADRIWAAFSNVPRWSLWNHAFWRSWVTGGELRENATIWLLFNPIRPWLPYKLPGPATIVELDERSVTWKVDIAGLHARHRYSVTPLDGGGCRFESWEVAHGPLFDAIRPCGLAHFRFVRDASLDGARHLV